MWQLLETPHAQWVLFLTALSVGGYWGLRRVQQVQTMGVLRRKDCSRWSQKPTQCGELRPERGALVGVGLSDTLTSSLKTLLRLPRWEQRESTVETVSSIPPLKRHAALGKPTSR
jgi:hypothetical protein